MDMDMDMDAKATLAAIAATRLAQDKDDNNNHDVPLILTVGSSEEPKSHNLGQEDEHEEEEAALVLEFPSSTRSRSRAERADCKRPRAGHQLGSHGTNKAPPPPFVKLGGAAAKPILSKASAPASASACDNIGEIGEIERLRKELHEVKAEAKRLRMRVETIQYELNAARRERREKRDNQDHDHKQLFESSCSSHDIEMIKTAILSLQTFNETRRLLHTPHMRIFSTVQTVTTMMNALRGFVLTQINLQNAVHADMWTKARNVLDETNDAWNEVYKFVGNSKQTV